MEFYSDVHKQEILKTAIHEASHAVFAWRHGVFRHGVFIIYLSVEPEEAVSIFGREVRPALSGRCKIDRFSTWYSRSGYLEHLVAGALGESFYEWQTEGEKREDFPRFADPEDLQCYGGECDLEGFLQVEPDPYELFKTVKKVARLLLHKRTWSAIESVADLLVRERFINGLKVSKIIEGVAPPRPRPKKSVELFSPTRFLMEKDGVACLMEN